MRVIKKNKGIQRIGHFGKEINYLLLVLIFTNLIQISPKYFNFVNMLYPPPKISTSFRVM